MLKIFIVVALTLFGSAASAQFGLEQGTPLSQLDVIKIESEDVYHIRVPLEHSNFEMYLANVTPQDGLCGVVGIGKTLENDRDGYRARQVFRELQQSLSQKYGRSKDYDFSHVGSIWNEPHEWAMSVHEEERSLNSIWLRQNGSRLPDDIAAIMLETNAISGTQTYVNLKYEFSNFETCLGRKEARDSRAL